MNFPIFILWGAITEYDDYVRDDGWSINCLCSEKQQLHNADRGCITAERITQYERGQDSKFIYQKYGRIYFAGQKSVSLAPALDQHAAASCLSEICGNPHYDKLHIKVQRML